MAEFRTEGLILQTLDFQENDQIFTLFSPHGVQKFIYKRSPSSKKKATPFSPLTQVEILSRIKNSELYPCQEISILSQNLGLRKNLEILESACGMINALLKTQMASKPAPDLYALLIKYFQTLPACPYPKSLESSFLLKLLNHEGLLADLTRCNICEEKLTALFFHKGEGFCATHKKEPCLAFDNEELTILLVSLYSRNIQEIASLPITESHYVKIKTILKEFVSH